MNHNMPPVAPGYNSYAGPADVPTAYPGQSLTGWESPSAVPAAWGGDTANGWSGGIDAAPYNYGQPGGYGNTAPGWGTATPNTNVAVGWSGNTASAAPGWGAPNPNAAPAAWGSNTSPNNSTWNGNTFASGYGGGYATANTAPGYSPTAAPVGGRGRLGNALAAAKEGLGRLFNRSESIQRTAPRAGAMVLQGVMGKSANTFHAQANKVRSAWTPERKEKASNVAKSVGAFAMRAAVEFGNEFGQEFGVGVRKNENNGFQVNVDKSKLFKEAVKFAVLPGRKAALAKNATQAAQHTAKTMVGGWR